MLPNAVARHVVRYWSETHNAVIKTFSTASGSRTFQPNHIKRS